MKHPATIIALVGAPGTGKTFLAETLTKRSDQIHYIPEPPLISRIVEYFKTNNNNLEIILYFLEQGIKNIHTAATVTDKPFVIMDTYYASTMLYISSLLSPFEEQLVQSFMDHIVEYLPTPDTIVWLTADIDIIIDRVQQRNRNFETNDDYLDRIRHIQKEHIDEFASRNVITIDKGRFDTTNEEDLLSLEKKIFSI